MATDSDQQEAEQDSGIKNDLVSELRHSVSEPMERALAEQKAFESKFREIENDQADMGADIDKAEDQLLLPQRDIPDEDFDDRMPQEPVHESFTVAVEIANNPGYIGINGTTGVVRTDSTITKTQTLAGDGFVTLSHWDSSTLSGSVGGSGKYVLQTITVDDRGHVTNYSTFDTSPYLTSEDLEPYVTDSELATALTDYYTQTQIDTMFTSYYTSTQVDTLLTSYDTAIIADGKYWHLGGNVSVCYGEAIGYDSTHQVIALDSTPELQTDWKCSGATDATTKTAAGFKCDGGIAAAKAMWAGSYVHADTGFQIASDVNNVWTATDLLAQEAGIVLLKAAGSAKLESASCYLQALGTDVNITALTGDIELSFSTLTLNGNAYTLMTVQLPDGSGGTQDVEIIGRVV
jgi:hypothetical protein